MIKVNSIGQVEVKNSNIANFKIKVSNTKVGKEVYIDLDPKSYLPNGSNSTGVFVLDMCTFVVDRFNDIVSAMNLPLITMDIFRKEGVNTDFNTHNGVYGGFTIDDVTCSKTFSEQKLPIVDNIVAFLNTFSTTINVGFSYHTDKKTVSTDGVETVSPYELISLMIRMYLYTYSQTCRDLLVVSGISTTFTESTGRSYSWYRTKTAIYDRFIDGIIPYNDSTVAVTAKDFYGLSRSNKTSSSGVPEVCTIEDYVYMSEMCHRGNLLERHDNSYAITTILKKEVRYDQVYNSVFSINIYKSIPNDCFISVRLRAHYNSLPTDVNSTLCTLFYNPSTYRVFELLKLLLDSCAIKIKHEDIVFDKSIDDIIDNSRVELSLDYTSYTKAGGARRSEYVDLANKKITPVSRRDELYNACCTLMSVANINKTKAFAKLDVDFKRFYGYTAKA